MDLVCIGKIVKSHGVRGAIKIESYTEDPLSLTSYKPLFLSSEKQEIQPSLVSSNGNFLVCKLKNIDSRNDADLLRGKKIYTTRQSLPLIEDDDDYYVEDLIGLDIKQDGELIGVVEDVHDYGAGSIVQIKFLDSKKSEMFAFTKENFPDIDMQNKIITFNQPEVVEYN